MRFFHGETGAAGRNTTWAAIAQTGSGRVGARLQARRVNQRRRLSFAGFHPGATPAVSERTVGIEIRSRGRRSDRLAGEDLGRLQRARRAGRRYHSFPTPHKYHATLQTYASHIRPGNNRRRAKLMIRVHEIGADQTQSEVSLQVQVKTAASHEPDFVIVPEDVRRQAMLAHQSFKKRGKIVGAKSQLGTAGDVEEFDVVNASGDATPAAAPVVTAVGRQAEPAGEVISYAAANAPRIPFQATGHRNRCSRKQPVHIAARVESG